MVETIVIKTVSPLVVFQLIWFHIYKDNNVLARQSTYVASWRYHIGIIDLLGNTSLSNQTLQKFGMAVNIDSTN